MLHPCYIGVSHLHRQSAWKVPTPIDGVIVLHAMTQAYENQALLYSIWSLVLFEYNRSLILTIIHER